MFSDFISSYGPSVLGGALFLATAWIVAYWADKLICRVLLTRSRLDPGFASVVGRIIRYSIFVLAGIAVLEELGVEVASLIAALGIFGFAVAIGLRTTSTNFFTGIMLFILKPYKVGDYIEGERAEGVVESMSLFHTVVVTKDGVYVAVPNAAMWARSVRNFSRSRPRCIEIDIAVERGKPFGELQTLIDGTLKAESLVFAGLRPLIRVIDAKDKTMTIRTAFWSEAETEREARKSVSDALRASLAAAGVTVTKIAAVKRKKPKKKAPLPPPAPIVDDVG